MGHKRNGFFIIRPSIHLQYLSYFVIIFSSDVIFHEKTTQILICVSFTWHACGPAFRSQKSCDLNSLLILYIHTCFSFSRRYTQRTACIWPTETPFCLFFRCDLKLVSSVSRAVCFRRARKEAYVNSCWQNRGQ